MLSRARTLMLHTASVNRLTPIQRWSVGWRRGAKSEALSLTARPQQKPFSGVNESQVQFHASSLSSLPSVTNTEENEGNEEQNRGNLTCD